MKKLFHIFVAMGLAAGLCGNASAQESEPLTRLDFSIVGVELHSSPGYQAVPRGIASQVDTAYVAAGEPLADDVVALLPKSFVVKADFTGPSYQTPLSLETKPGEPFTLPQLPILGKYTLGNIRIEDGKGNALFAAVPQAVTIESIKDPLITSVVTRPLTLQELQERGVTFDSSNFTAYEFTAAIATESGQVPISFPVLIPDSYQIPEQEAVHNPDLGISPPSFNNLPPPPDTNLPSTMTFTPITIEVEGDPVLTAQLPPIPGIVVFPGNIGFLHQYFSALAIVTNGAPGVASKNVM